MGLNTFTNIINTFKYFYQGMNKLNLPENQKIQKQVGQVLK